MTVPAVRVALGLATSSLMVAGTSTSGSGSAAAAPDDRPNVVVIMVDDMSTTEMQYLPKVNALLADEGVMFDEAFNNTPVCCPSRATLLTGQHSRHHGVYTNKPTQGQGYQALDSSNTLATWMTASGYETTFIGKYLNGYGQWGYLPDVPNNREVPPGWSDFQALVGNISYQDYTINDNGRLVDYGSATEDYQTDVLADRAVASIVDAADSGRALVHVGRTAFAAHHQRSAAAPRTSTSAFLRRDRSAPSAQLRRGRRVGQTAVRPQPTADHRSGRRGHAGPLRGTGGGAPIRRRPGRGRLRGVGIDQSARQHAHRLRLRQRLHVRQPPPRGQGAGVRRVGEGSVGDPRWPVRRW